MNQSMEQRIFPSLGLSGRVTCFFRPSLAPSTSSLSLSLSLSLSRVAVPGRRAAGRRLSSPTALRADAGPPASCALRRLEKPAKRVAVGSFHTSECRGGVERRQKRR